MLVLLHKHKMRGVTDAIKEFPDNRFCKAVIQMGITPIIDLHPDTPDDALEHFKHKSNVDYGHLDYRPPEILDDMPGSLIKWEIHKEEKSIKA